VVSEVILIQLGSVLIDVITNGVTLAEFDARWPVARQSQLPAVALVHFALLWCVAIIAAWLSLGAPS
jgi:hypothetical protein